MLINKDSDVLCLFVGRL